MSNDVETGWLIEVVTGGRAWWWSGYVSSDSGMGWTTDPHDAVRFARQLDAERARERLALTDPTMLLAFTTDHMWIPSGVV